MFFFLFLSAYFMSSETAITAVSKVKLKQLENEGDVRAKRLNNLLEDSTRLLSTILFGNNIAQNALAALVTTASFRWLNRAGLSAGWAIPLSTIVTTFLILVFAEVTPKSYAFQRAEKIALFTAVPMSVIHRLFSPFAIGITAIANSILRLFGLSLVNPEPFVIEDEIKTLVDLGEEEGVIEEEEKEIIEGVFEFSETLAREVMVPRVDIVALDVNSSFDEAIDTINMSGHSRIPVYDETIDNIVGIIYAKDLLKFFGSKNPPPLRSIMRAPYYVPETKPIDELFREMRAQKVHMAIIIDEYGGTAGLVTIEDILEELVGEIMDEYDINEEAMIERVALDEIIVDGRMNLEELNEILGVELPAEETDTLAGFVYDHISHIPKPGEEFEYNGVIIRVEEVRGRRITKLRIKKAIKGEENEEVD
ncbi:MAG TPA: hemolysin family protein [bacterium]|nr:hemolysin family protein [bacterium]HOL55057.1 hemolysin family protein [bacterium]